MRIRDHRGLALGLGIAVTASLIGCGTARSTPRALADSEIRIAELDSSVALGGDWRLTGDSVGLWLMDSGERPQSPMIFAIASDGRPEFVTGDSLGMLLVTGDVTAIANVLEEGDLD
ncbi:MAG: hypothetical protein H6814_05485 [Phycisphaeraceae bacterium]|nr:hypothetical protein [Phycisphaeraceae bacterium]